MQPSSFLILWTDLTANYGKCERAQNLETLGGKSEAQNRKNIRLTPKRLT